MSGVTVTFNYTAWIQRYPEFKNISNALADLYFAEACLYIDNTGRGPVIDPNVQTIFLNMATAHIAALNSPVIGGEYTDGTGSIPGPTLVGRIASATEGSVTASAEMPEQPGSAAWWQQTKYGAALWQASLPYRLGRYIVGRRPNRVNPYFYGLLGGGWGG